MQEPLLFYSNSLLKKITAIKYGKSHIATDARLLQYGFCYVRFVVLFRKISHPGFPDDIHLNLPRIFQLGLNLL